MRLGLMILLSGGLAAGCASDKTRLEAGAEGTGTVGAEAAPPPPLVPLAVLPADAFAVVHVDFARLRASEHGDRVLGWLAKEIAETPEAEQLVRAAFAASREAFVGLSMRAGERDADVVAVARGDFPAGQLGVLMAAGNAPAAEAGATHSRGEVRAKEIDGETWLFGTTGVFDQAAARADAHAQGRGPLEADDLGSMAQRIGFGQAAATAVIRAPRSLKEELGDDRFLARETAEALRILGARIELTKSIDVELVATLDSEAEAKRLAERTRTLARWAGGNTFVRLFGLSPLFRGIDARSEASEAVVSLRVEDADARALLSKLERMGAQLLDQGGFDVEYGIGSAPEAPTE